MEKFDLSLEFDGRPYKLTVVKYTEPVTKFEVISNSLQDFGLSESFWLYPDKETKTINIDEPEAAEFKSAVADALTSYAQTNNLSIFWAYKMHR